jgi:5-(carboxyamino)imidazole ribonucleotide mutase
VACTTIGKAGAKNAALIAAQILAITDNQIAERLQHMREEKRQALRKADEKLQAEVA